jgi:hypothetical protein
MQRRRKIAQFDTPARNPLGPILNQSFWEKCMKVLELVGTRVWIRCDQFRRISGVIANVLKPVSRDDLQSSIAESLFDITLPSGKVIQLLGAQLYKVDHLPKQVVIR